ncbi:DUF2238 domain-containing protein [Methylohalobius crimeensis]|uniref:DUF2238 domain-containing protein n=1 Tax=Methylohalobius crimeensis TaxID=244365 RepID=UPI0003B65E05|nr:DUF2238 domain-containing protein [Methylohalobius crimeensis]
MRLKPIHKWVTLGLQTILLVGVVLAIWEQRWSTAATTTVIILATLVPLLLGKRFRVFIPPEFELLATLFVFASLFLGEMRGYYVRFWWWDIVLHTASGFLFGIIGFLLVYVLNEKKEIDLHMNPGFVALFAFMFALGIGALWEIFEFGIDQFFGMNMQKAMLGDSSGLTDTMWDLIVDAVGAAVIAIMGYGYLKTAGTRSFLEQWIEAFVEANPHFFRRDR